jgi:hypothetical protein
MCYGVMRRSLRLGDENYGWLSALPGRTLNDALTEYRVGLVNPDGNAPLTGIRRQVDNVIMALDGLPDADAVADIMRSVIGEFKAQKVTPSQIPSTSMASNNSTGFDPASIPGVSRGPSPNSLPFPCRCIHSGCKGSKFQGAGKFANLCPECKRVGACRRSSELSGMF